jgi:hypothetical protein
MSDESKLIAFCPHCGNTAPQRLAFKHTYHTTWYESDGTPDDNSGPECEAIVCICETCDQVLLYDGISAQESGALPALRYPLSQRLHDSVPERVRACYEEASRTKLQAPNAFAVMIRRAIEEICDDRKIPSGTLAKRLKKLAERGDIPPTLAEITDVLRLLGNMGAHAATKSVTVPQTWAIDDFFRVVIEYVYVAPSKLAKFRERHGHNSTNHRERGQVPLP